MMCRIRSVYSHKTGLIGLAKNLGLRLFPLLLVSCISQGFTSGKSSVKLKSEEPSEKKQQPAYPYEAWLQKWLLSQHKEGWTGEIWCLFSSGGFAGAGQGHWLITSGTEYEDKQTIRVFYIAPDIRWPESSSSVILPQKEVNKEQIKMFLEASEHFPEEEFQNTIPLMDGYRYHYIHLKKSSTGFQQLLSFETEEPNQHAEKKDKDRELKTEQHHKLISAFRNLTRKKIPAQQQQEQP
ncbi:MAG: hypothetical protein H6618_02380 [Deltaproteobacteria bacterium]|nr:hypothetical protein [Deltaproteobacteria bacterium]